MTDLSKVTSSCYCGAVKLEYSLEGDNLLLSVSVIEITSFEHSKTRAQFICHCTDDRKITSSMFATNFCIKDRTVKHISGQSNLTKYERKHGIATGDQMDSYFCKTCGSLMYRISSGFPGVYIMRLGQVDDFSLHDTVLKPDVEHYVKNRVAWAKPAEGVKQEMGNVITPKDVGPFVRKT